MKRQVYLPMETFSREYLGKLSLALELAKIGHEVLIGSTHTIRSLSEGATENAVYYEIKGESGISSPHLSKLRQKKILTVLQDEEAGISYLNYEDFVKLRPELFGLNHFNKIFAWGNVDYEFMSAESVDKTIELTGSPRAVFWGSFGEAFYREITESLRAVHGEYILLITNFAWQNSLKSNRQEQKYFEESNYDSEFYSSYRRRLKWEHLAYIKTLDLIRSIIENTNYKIILRPHPSERSDVWMKAFPNESRLMIHKEGDVTPAILGASHTLHAGSTVGIEALLHKQSTISYQSLINFVDFPMTANKYSAGANSLEALIAMLGSGLVYGAKEGFSSFINQRISSLQTCEPIKVQAEAISELKSSIEPGFVEDQPVLPSDRNNFMLRVKNRLLYGKSAYESLSLHKRPEITLEKIESDSKKVSGILGHENRFTIEKISESTFRILKCP